jgi:capsular polysaccharide biosynthesis protein/Mrp family chromosome partitioning ATPase
VISAAGSIQGVTGRSNSPVRCASMSSSQPSFVQYLHVLRRQLWLIALVTLVTLGVAAAVNATKQPVYRASMKVVVGQGGGVFQPQFGNVVQPFTQTMTNLLQSEIVARRVIEKLNLKLTPKDLLADLHVSARPDSSVLQVTFDSPTKRSVVVILREVGNVFTQLVERKLGRENPTDTALPPITATVFDPAYLEEKPVSPSPTRTLFFAGAIALILGGLLAFVRESLDNTVRGRRDAEEVFKAPVIGSFPRQMIGRVPFGIPGRPPPKRRDQLRAPDLLRAHLQFSENGAGGLSVLVTSAAASEGKSTVAANLAVVLAMAGESVICVDADLARPKLETYLQVPPDGRGGLVEVLSGEVALESSLREVSLTGGRVEGRAVGAQVVSAAASGLSQAAATANLAADRGDGTGRLRLLPSGPTPKGRQAVLNPAEFRSLADRLRALARYVIFDAPPLLAGPDVFPLLTVADKVLVVAREGRSTRDAATLARETLDRLRVPDVSVVLVDATEPTGVGYY